MTATIPAAMFLKYQTYWNSPKNHTSYPKMLIGHHKNIYIYNENIYDINTSCCTNDENIQNSAKGLHVHNMFFFFFFVSKPPCCLVGQRSGVVRICQEKRRHKHFLFFRPGNCLGFFFCQNGSPMIKIAPSGGGRRRSARRWKKAQRRSRGQAWATFWRTNLGKNAEMTFWKNGSFVCWRFQKLIFGTTVLVELTLSILFIEMTHDMIFGSTVNCVMDRSANKPITVW